MTFSLPSPLVKTDKTQQYNQKSGIYFKDYLFIFRCLNKCRWRNSCHHCLTKSTIIAYLLYNESKLLNIIYTFSVAVKNTLFQLHNSTVACIIRMAVSRPRQSKLTPNRIRLRLISHIQKIIYSISLGNEL